MGPLVRFILSCCIFLCSTVALSQQQNWILWGESNPLEWKDFKSRPDSKSKFSALTSSTFGISAKAAGNNAVNVRVTSKFIPERSWVKKGKTKDELLRHEQLHFDLCEVYARELRKQMQNKKDWNPKKFNKDFKKMSKRVLKDYMKEQERYDKETNHSLKKDKQKTWEDETAERLTRLKDYSATLFKIEF